MVLRLLILKHARNWSYEVPEREVRANLVYRDFTHIGSEKVPNPKTLLGIGQVLGPEVIEQLRARVLSGTIPNQPLSLAIVCTLL